jgi:ubiquinone/menaquinone biosynthesis C-methylase UbiE
MALRRRIWLAAGIPVLLGGAFAGWYWRDTTEAEVARLAAILEWKPGRVVGEIGAGKGNMSVAAAKQVGASGHIFTTEISAERLAEIRKRVASENLKNVSVIEAGETDSNLPAGCCDAVFMRTVYHHFTRPVEINRTVFRALRPGGLLAIVDFSPSWWLTLIAPIRGAPANRGGHGVPREVLIQEVTGVGFRLDRVVSDWPGHTYCVLFRKPHG